MSRIVLFPYKMGSKSAKALANELDAIRVYPDRKYRQRATDTVINWGSAKIPKWENGKILNNPRNIMNASNKVKAFQLLTRYQVPTVDWTVDIRTAQDWDWVVVRNEVSGHGGVGIEIVEGHEVPYAELYTRFVGDTKEVRVHIFNGKVIDYTEKRKKLDFDGVVNPRVRNHTNGWVFCRESVEKDEKVQKVAIKAIEALGLDFGSVDIIITSSGEPLVLEVNTASGIMGTTLNAYVNAIQEYENNN